MRIVHLAATEKNSLWVAHFPVHTKANTHKALFHNQVDKQVNISLAQSSLFLLPWGV